MTEQFDQERFDLVDEERVHLADHAFSHNDRGELDVWKSVSDGGTAFVRRSTIRGRVAPLRQGVNGLGCYFLRERASSRMFFLERSARGYFLQNSSFSGAETYFGRRADEIDAWLAGRVAARTSPGLSAAELREPAHGDRASGPSKGDV